MHAAMESCPFKTVMAGGMGFGLGGVFGLFMASVCPPPPLCLPLGIFAKVKRKVNRAK